MHVTKKKKKIENTIKIKNTWVHTYLHIKYV